jgi:hypothetical protein
MKINTQNVFEAIHFAMDEFRLKRMEEVAHQFAYLIETPMPIHVREHLFRFAFEEIQTSILILFLDFCSFDDHVKELLLDDFDKREEQVFDLIFRASVASSLAILVYIIVIKNEVNHFDAFESLKKTYHQAKDNTFIYPAFVFGLEWISTITTWDIQSILKKSYEELVVEELNLTFFN